MIPKKLFKTEECQLFLSVLPNQNFMSPHVVDYIRIGDYVVELSTDHTQTSATKLVGVTVVNVVTKNILASLTIQWRTIQSSHGNEKEFLYVEDTQLRKPTKYYGMNVRERTD